MFSPQDPAFSRASDLHRDIRNGNLRRNKCVITIQVIRFILPNSYRGTRMIALSSYRPHLPYLRLKMSLLLLTVLGLSVWVVRAQTSNPKIAFSQMRIAQNMELIRVADQEHLSQAYRGALWAQLEGGRCLQQVAGPAEDCTISQSSLCLNTRQPRFALSDLRPCG